MVLALSSVQLALVKCLHPCILGAEPTEPGLWLPELWFVWDSFLYCWGPPSLEADPFTSSLVVLDAFLFALHSFHWTCLPTLTLAVLAWKSFCLPSRCGPKASASLACLVSLGTYLRPWCLL